MGDREVDQQLVERAQRGDKRAFELLVMKYQRKLGRLLSRLVRDPAEVEDVTQEAFIKAYRALPSFRGRQRVLHVAVPDRDQHGEELPGRAWAGGRRRRPASTTRRPRVSRMPSSCATRATPEDELIGKQIAATVNRAMDALPEDLRTAITLREIEGLSYEEIANVMNCPIGTVRSRIFRAREAIAAELRPLLGTDENRRW